MGLCLQSTNGRVLPFGWFHLTRLTAQATVNYLIVLKGTGTEHTFVTLFCPRCYVAVVMVMASNIAQHLDVMAVKTELG